MKSSTKNKILKFFLIFFAVIIFAILLIVNSINNTTILGINKDKFNKYVEALNVPVDLNTYAQRQITELDKENVKNKFVNNGLSLFKDNEIILNATSYTIDNNFEVTSNEISAFLNMAVEQKIGNFFEILQCDISTKTNFNEYSVLTITKINLKSLKKEIKTIKDFPDYFYVKTISDVSVLGGTMQITNSAIQINEIPETMVEEISTLINNIFAIAEIDFNVKDALNRQYFEILNSIQRKSNFEFELETNKIIFQVKV